MKQMMKLSVIEKLFLILLLVVFGGIVLHAPFIVGMETIFPDYELLIKSWKEILLTIATALAFIILMRRNAWRLFHDPIVIVAGLFGLLHILLLPIFWNGTLPVLAGLMIDLRYILFFLLVYLAVQLYPWLRGLFLKIAVIGASIVVGFALLQVFVLPPDTLSHIGYNDSTISPYLTVDKNPDYIRINSTLRGPNSVGAYALIVLSAVLAFFLSKKSIVWNKRNIWLIALLSLGGLVALWASYSRSAWIAAIVALLIVVAVTIGRKLPKWGWITGMVVVFALVGGLVAARDSDFISNVILHENPNGGSSVSSNDGHAESLADGTKRLLTQPLGAGVGSTGSASLLGDHPLVIENQYLFVAHEVGWLGLGLFMALFVMILKKLWGARTDWLAIAVFASGIGLALIGLLLPVWVDDTIAIIWWGLAAIVIGGKHRA